MFRITETKSFFILIGQDSTSDSLFLLPFYTCQADIISQIDIAHFSFSAFLRCFLFRLPNRGSQRVLSPTDQAHQHQQDTVRRGKHQRISAESVRFSLLDIPMQFILFDHQPDDIDQQIG